MIMLYDQRHAINWRWDRRAKFNCIGAIEYRLDHNHILISTGNTYGTKENRMTNSRELKANLRRDDNALELAAVYVRALYLLNMSKRNVDCDQRHNFGATKELLISVMGENIIDDYEYGFYDQDMFNPECTAKDIDDFYSGIIKSKEENEEDQHCNELENYHEWLRQEVTTLDNAILWHDTSEKFTFCLDLLELSLCKNGDSYCDHYVCELEDKFAGLLVDNGCWYDK